MADEAPEETPEETPGFTALLNQMVKARRREPGRVLGAIAKGALRGAAGLGPAPEAPGRDDTEMAMLMKQAETLGGLEEAAIGDPSELAGKRLEFLETLLAEARQRLNKKADVYSAGEMKRAGLLLDTMQGKVDDARQTLITLEGEAGSDSDADGAGFSMGKVRRTFLRIQADLMKGTTETGVRQTMASTIANGRLNQAEEDYLLRMMGDKSSYLGAKEGAETAEAEGAYARLGRFASDSGRPIPTVLAELKAQLGKFRETDASMATSSDPEATAEALSGGDEPLRNAILRRHYEFDEETGDLKRNERGEPILTPQAEIAITENATLQGQANLYSDMEEQLNSMAMASSGGEFAGEIKQMFAAFGAADATDLFKKYGLDTASVQAAGEVVRGEYSGQRKAVQDRLKFLAQAPKAPIARAAYEAKAHPGFEKAMQEMGVTDPTVAMKALARQAGTVRNVQRAESRQRIRQTRQGAPSFAPSDQLAARKAATQKRVISDLQGVLRGRTGPELVEE